jgi:hypothetical protein
MLGFGLNASIFKIVHLPLKILIREKNARVWVRCIYFQMAPLPLKTLIREKNAKVWVRCICKEQRKICLFSFPIKEKNAILGKKVASTQFFHVCAIALERFRGDSHTIRSSCLGCWSPRPLTDECAHAHSKCARAHLVSTKLLPRQPQHPFLNCYEDFFSHFSVIPHKYRNFLLMTCKTLKYQN